MKIMNINDSKTQFVFYKENEDNNKMILFNVPDIGISVDINELIQIIERYKTQEIIQPINENNQINNEEDTSSSISDSISICSSEFTTLNGIVRHISEPDDYLIHLTDKELIARANLLLTSAKKYNIEEFYKKNKLPPRRFNLSGLYTTKSGIKTEKQRYLIRDLCRICKDFYNSDYAENKRNVFTRNLQRT